MGFNSGVRLEMEMVHVVDQQQIDFGHAQALLTVLVRAHDSIVGVIKIMIKRKAAKPLVRINALAGHGWPEDTPDFCRQNELVARLATQGMAHAVFAQGPAVPGGGVVEPHAGIPGTAHGGLRVVFGDMARQFANAGTAVAQLGDRNPGLAYCSFLEWVHNHLPLPVLH